MAILTLAMAILTLAMATLITATLTVVALAWWARTSCASSGASASHARSLASAEVGERTWLGLGWARGSGSGSGSGSGQG